MLRPTTTLPSPRTALGLGAAGRAPPDHREGRSPNTPPLPSVKPSTRDGSRKMQQSKYLRLSGDSTARSSCAS